MKGSQLNDPKFKGHIQPENDKKVYGKITAKMSITVTMSVVPLALFALSCLRLPMYPEFKGSYPATAGVRQNDQKGYL